MPNATLTVLSPDNPALQSFLFYSALLVLKVLAVPLLIARLRFTRMIFISPEDAAFTKKWFNIGQVKTDDPDLERVRRAHMNDIENIPLFLVTALGYLFTAPCPRVAAILFLIYTIARYLHTFVYAIFVVPQPARILCYLLGQMINIYMIICIIVYYSSGFI